MPGHARPGVSNLDALDLQVMGLVGTRPSGQRLDVRHEGLRNHGEPSGQSREFHQLVRAHGILLRRPPREVVLHGGQSLARGNQ